MKHTSIIKHVLPFHVILYTGLDKRAAKREAKVGRALAFVVDVKRERVVGSKLSDPNPWHYTVIGTNPCR